MAVVGEGVQADVDVLIGLQIDLSFSERLELYSARKKFLLDALAMRAGWRKENQARESGDGSRRTARQISRTCGR